MLHTVRGRLFLLIAALVVPAVAIISVLSWEAYRGQRSAIRSELQNTARAVASVVDSEIDRSVAILQTLAAARSPREKDWETLDAMARRILASADRWFVVVDMSGRQLVNTRLPRGEAIPGIELDPGYLAAMQAGTVYVSNVIYGPAARGKVVHVGIPFVHGDGGLYGFNIVMTPEGMGETLNVRRFSPEGVMSVVDREGVIIARNPHQKEFIGAPATPDMVAAVRARWEGVRDSVTLEEIPVITVIERARCGWSVLVGMPKAKLFATTQRLFLIALGSALLATLGAVWMAAWIARAVVGSVDDLAQDAGRLARGETPASRTGELEEIETVAQAMRRLAETRTEAETQLREARDRLHQYAQELELKVQERTASLRDAVTQMEEFSYTVSHDLRGPLRAMSGYATVLLEDHGESIDPVGREHLQRIIRASERMSRLTSDLLTYSRIARAALQRERLALEPIVRGIIDHYNELSSTSADITIVSPLEDVLGHEPSITQALANLLTNAAKFVKPGERPQITVRTERRGNRVRIWIEDRGIGIDPAHQERLFRIFERAPTAGTYDGTGVGLAIVRKIVEKSGGTCGVESDGESGSRFWIELERPTDAVENTTNPIEAASRD